MVGHGTLDAGIMVRAHVPQKMISKIGFWPILEITCYGMGSNRSEVKQDFLRKQKIAVERRQMRPSGAFGADRDKERSDAEAHVPQ